MWGLTIVGVCLILGLFTRLASLAGIGFILLFYLAAPPFIGYFYAIPSEGSYLIVNKNLVELSALVVILLTGSGRFAGTRSDRARRDPARAPSWPGPEEARSSVAPPAASFSRGPEFFPISRAGLPE